MTIKPHMQGDDLTSWHFRIAWSYFYLGDSDNAQAYFERYLEMSDYPQDEVPVYLDCIALANAENQRRNCAQIYNQGNIATADRIYFMQKALAEYAPPLLERLGESATEEELLAFEQKFGAALPEDFKALHRMFSGQKDDKPFLFEGERWISLAEIPAWQAKITDYLERHFGTDWHSITMPVYNRDHEDDPTNAEATFFDSGIVKNTLYSDKWLPLFAVDENCIACLNADPDAEGEIGQIVEIQLAETLKDYSVNNIGHLGIFATSISSGLKLGHYRYDSERNALKQIDEYENEQFSPLYDAQEEAAFIAACETHWGRVGKIIRDPEYDGSDDLPKCDILVIYPDPDDPEDDGGYALITCGVGAIPMSEAVPPFTELVIHLPSSWNPDSSDPKDTAPQDWLRKVANLVFDGSYLDTGHTIPLGEMTGTDFTGVMLWKASAFDENDPRDYLVADLPNEREVSYISLVPIYAGEMDYRLAKGSHALADKLFQLPLFPVELDPNRPNTCAGYVASSHPHALESVAWAFGSEYFAYLNSFAEAVQEYNAYIGNDLSHFNLFAVLFNSKTVKFVYTAWLKHPDELYEFEAVDLSIFDGSSEEGYQAEIIATATSESDKMLALEFLQWVNNALYRKELGDHIFFEGIELIGQDDNGVPVVALHLGS